MSQFSIVPAIAAAFLAAAAVPAAAQQASPAGNKLGYVNTDRVMNESKVTKKLKQELDDKFVKRTKEIDGGPKDQIERRRRALDEEMALEREDTLRQFVDKTNRIIRRIALAENFDAVFLEAAYFSKRIDITEKVIKELDSGR